MDEQERDERLREIAARFGWTAPQGILGGSLGGWGPPFDVTRPNIHDTKAEFLKEKAVVAEASEKADQIIRFLAAGHISTEPDHLTASRVCEHIDTKSRARPRPIPTQTVVDTISLAALDHSLTRILVFLLLKMRWELSERERDLEDQENTFWSQPNRAPNHYARTIALRFAKLVARETGQYPTFGTSRDGGYPSTAFGRALEEIFALLGIRASVRNAARWAIDQLTEDDLKKETLGSLFGFGLGLEVSPPEEESMSEQIAAALLEGRKS